VKPAHVLAALFVLALTGCATPVSPAPDTPSARLVAGSTSVTAAIPPSSQPASPGATVPPAPTAVPALTAIPVMVTSVPPLPATDTSLAATPPAKPVAKSGEVTVTLLASATEVRFRVREQLAGRSLPNDAVGATRSITGTIVLDETGKVLARTQPFAVDMRTLKTDESRRDSFIQRSTLETAKYPSATFMPRTLSSLASPLPQSGDVSFQMTGDLTVHGVTKSVTWQVTGTVNGEVLTGKATTAITFEDFGMSPPRVAVVLAVEDKIGLEMDYQATRQK
jgi:polyisoprenoid-binding protein YceI